MAAVLGLASCTSADNIAQITPSATLGAATSAPTSNGAEPAVSTAPVGSNTESTASSAPAGSSTEPTASTGPASNSAQSTASSAPSSTASDTPAELCPEAPAPLNAGNASLEFTTELTMGGVPFIYGEPNALDGGGTLMPLNFRFYVSEVALVRADGTEVRVDIVNDLGAPVHYGVHLVNAEEPSSMRFRVLAPPGSYTGALFLLGVNDACNAGFDGREPFSAASGMTWPHGFGYLFLRYEGTVVAGGAPDAGDAPDAPDAGDAGAGETPPDAVHMGGLKGILLAPRVQAPGEFTTVESAAASVRLVFDVGALFEGATSSLDLSDINPLLPPEPEVALGERARRLAPELPLFTLEPQ
jgi:hypothetical protein